MQNNKKLANVVGVSFLSLFFQNIFFEILPSTYCKSACHSCAPPCRRLSKVLAHYYLLAQGLLLEQLDPWKTNTKKASIPSSAKSLVLLHLFGWCHHPESLLPKHTYFYNIAASPCPPVTSTFSQIVRFYVFLDMATVNSLCAWFSFSHFSHEVFRLTPLVVFEWKN